MRCKGVLSVDMLLDDVLLSIFDFGLDDEEFTPESVAIAVCRKWRTVVFLSRRLNLRLQLLVHAKHLCGICWIPGQSLPSSFWDNVMGLMAALEHSDIIGLYILGSRLTDGLKRVREPFLELIDLLSI
jgi:hypothetical protein